MTSARVRCPGHRGKAGPPPQGYYIDEGFNSLGAAIPETAPALTRRNFLATLKTPEIKLGVIP